MAYLVLVEINAPIIAKVCSGKIIVPSHNTFFVLPLNKDSVNLPLEYEWILTKEGEIASMAFQLSVEGYQLKKSYMNTPA